MATFAIQQRSVNGMQPEVAIVGSGDTTLLLLHAIGLSWQMWAPVLAQLPNDLTAIAMDLRGHGAAAGTPPTSLEQHAADVDELLRMLGCGVVHVIGLSYGAAVAQTLALRSPQRLASLTLLSSFSRAPADTLRDRAAQAEAHGISSQIPGTLERWFSSKAVADNVDGVRFARAQLEAVDVRNWAAAWRALAALDLTDVLPSVNVRTAVIAGELDPGTTPALMRETIAAKLPNAVFSMIPGVSHLSALEAPKAVADLVCAHVNGDSVLSRT